MAKGKPPPSADLDHSEQQGKRRRFVSSYSIFSGAFRDRLRVEQPGVVYNMATFAAMCSAAWSSLAPEEKQQYADEAARRREHIRSLEPPPPPKRPMTSFIYYTSMRRKEIQSQNPELSLMQVSRQCGDEWKLFTAETKADWKVRAEAASIRLQREHPSKRNGGGDDDDAESKRRRYISSYSLFSSAFRERLRAEQPGEVYQMAAFTSMCSEAWGALEPTEKQRYTDEAARRREEYRSELPPKPPKRPMTSFIFYTSVRRKEIQRENPELSLMQVSRQCGDEWNLFSAETKAEWKALARSAGRCDVPDELQEGELPGIAI
eukprot:CAMPEP_0119370068 /NCGR_PEP_ID=MMETSP1334-20130426/16492_1 /TAXON_ID=127549 /ORGANISM="Calcidiscus leptoporus, Strain RCC1130" /LENGTH=319 /DNA_ID=CAMNT_0007387049 /DNA_START=105 /DNA_END=1061 /DNA_ORIENTATION=-